MPIEGALRLRRERMSVSVLSPLNQLVSAQLDRSQRRD